MDRRVRATKRDRQGNIVALCNPEESWSPRRIVDVARDISTNQRSYYVQERERRTYVRLLSGGVLQTTNDVEGENSLARLPTV